MASEGPKAMWICWPEVDMLNLFGLLDKRVEVVGMVGSVDEVEGVEGLGCCGDVGLRWWRSGVN